MSKSAISVINTNSGASLTSGSAYPVTQVARRFGCGLSANGIGITCGSTGYYKVSGAFNVQAATAGNLTGALYCNGAPVSGASNVITFSADGYGVFPVDTIIRVNCCGNPAELAFVITGGEFQTVNAELTAFKL